MASLPATEPRRPTRRRAGPRLAGRLRYLWTQLTSMRTALVLLFALAWRRSRDR